MVVLAAGIVGFLKFGLPWWKTRLPTPSGAVTPDFKSFKAEFKAASGLSGSISDRLLRIYGTRAPEVLKLAAKDPSLAATFNKEADAIAAEVVFSFKSEMAETLTDCLMRRTMLGLNSVCGLDAVDAVAEIAQRSFRWTDDRVQQEKADYRTYVARP